MCWPLNLHRKSCFHIGLIKAGKDLASVCGLEESAVGYPERTHIPDLKSPCHSLAYKDFTELPFSTSCVLPLTSRAEQRR